MKSNCHVGIKILLVLGLIGVMRVNSQQDWNTDIEAMQAELHGAHPKPQSLKIFWGADTNNIKAGLVVDYYSSQAFQTLTDDSSSIPIRCFPLLCNDNTNNSDLLLLDLPSVKSRYKMDLTNDQGNAVSKTAEGESLGKAIPTFYRPSPNRLTGVTIDTGWRPARYTLFPEQPRNLEPPILLQNYFKITNSGKYHLHFEMTAFQVDPAKGAEAIIYFPPVDAEIDIQIN